MDAGFYEPPVALIVSFGRIYPAQSCVFRFKSIDFRTPWSLDVKHTLKTVNRSVHLRDLVTTDQMGFSGGGRGHFRTFFEQTKTVPLRSDHNKGPHETTRLPRTSVFKLLSACVWLCLLDCG